MKISATFDTQKGRQTGDVIKVNKTSVWVMVKDKKGNPKAINRKLKKYNVVLEGQ